MLRANRSAVPLACAVLAASLALGPPAEAGRSRGGGGSSGPEPTGHQTYLSPQSRPIALSPDGQSLFVAATTSNRVDVRSTGTLGRLGTVEVGLEPVGLAVKPDGSEVWVANHVSDSVSVIDADPSNTSFLQVVETVQEIDAEGVTLFDEPVGVAFSEDGSKAYVTLSSRNDIAIVDTSTYQVTGRLHVTAQDPRALAVRNGKLFVAAFESGNRTELSACESFGQDPACTLNIDDLGAFATDPNLSNDDADDEVKHIQVDPDLPDRDLFVYDTGSDTLLEAVEGVGTLLYGLAVSSAGEVFVTQTDARNADNGSHGERLVALENRLFLNQVTRVDCGGGSCGAPSRIDLEPLPSDGNPNPPAPGDALATPYGVALSADDSTLVATAAGSSRVFTLDTGTGAVLDRLDVGAIPRGVALQSDPATGAPKTAWVLNTLGNSVTKVDVSDPTSLAELVTFTVGNDPTPDAVRLGRIAFNDASASTSRTFSCASCHPDGNTDQLLWRIGGECADCDVIDGEHGHEPRTTMPIRGLRDSLPLHWDGTLGDPIGGPNGFTGSDGSAPKSCEGSDPRTCFRDLIDATLTGPLCDQTDCPLGPSGLAGKLTTAERDDMAAFLESVSYPPARSRRPDDVLSAAAKGGAFDFFTDQGGFVSQPDTCADSDAGCHELPLGTGTNSLTLDGFDAPTMRGLTDRFQQFSLSPTSAEEVLLGLNDGTTVNFMGFDVGIPENAFGDWSRSMGLEETFTFGAAFTIFDPAYGVGPLDLFQLFEETSTGHSGTLGRQVTLNADTTSGGELAGTEALLDELEDAAGRGVVVVQGRALEGNLEKYIQYRPDTDDYEIGGNALSRSALLSEAQSGAILATLTAELPAGVSESSPQPLVAPPGANCGTAPGNSTGDPGFLEMEVGQSSTTLSLEAAHVTGDARVFLDGQPRPGADVTLTGGSPVCGAEAVTPDPIELDLGTVPAEGVYALQVQTPDGLLSNELPLIVLDFQ